MDLQNVIFNKIMLYNSHPVADMLKSEIESYNDEQNERIIKVFKISFIKWVWFGRFKSRLTNIIFYYGPGDYKDDDDVDDN